MRPMSPGAEMAGIVRRTAQALHPAFEPRRQRRADRRLLLRAAEENAHPAGRLEERELDLTDVAYAAQAQLHHQFLKRQRSGAQGPLVDRAVLDHEQRLALGTAEGVLPRRP